MKRLLHKNAKLKRAAHGFGLFATGPVKKGEVVAEYWGEIVTGEEMIRSKGKYFFELENGMAINGKPRANMGRYINHSCSPNCEPQEDEQCFQRGRPGCTVDERHCRLPQNLHLSPAPIRAIPASASPVRSAAMPLGTSAPRACATSPARGVSRVSTSSPTTTPGCVANDSIWLTVRQDDPAVKSS